VKPYCDPTTVQGPKKRVSNVHVVYDGGPDGCAVAKLDWDGEPGVGIRWNGNPEESPLGNPQSRGNPVWFLVPPEFEDLVLERARALAPESDLDAGYRDMAADAEREREALEWSNALIGDASHASR
jgi:hypothetical protein